MTLHASTQAWLTQERQSPTVLQSRVVKRSVAPAARSRPFARRSVASRTAPQPAVQPPPTTHTHSARAVTYTQHYPYNLDSQHTDPRSGTAPSDSCLLSHRGPESAHRLRLTSVCVSTHGPTLWYCPLLTLAFSHTEVRRARIGCASPRCASRRRRRACCARGSECGARGWCERAAAWTTPQRPPAGE
jgi:hypothetical protein